MALGTVHAGYGNSLCAYSVYFRGESELSYPELLAELTRSLELAWKGGQEEPVAEEGAGENPEQTEAHSNRKKEWEDILEQSIVLEARLQQMLENGLGQQKEEQQNQPKKNPEDELDNEFDLLSIPMDAEGRHKTAVEYSDFPGNSEFFRNSSGGGSEYFSPAAAGRQKPPLRTICLTCQVECDRKKQWKVSK